MSALRKTPPRNNAVKPSVLLIFNLFYVQGHKLLNTCYTFFHKTLTRSPKRHHSVLLCEVTKHLQILLTDNGVTHILVHIHNLVYGNSALVARSVAELAALRTVNADWLVNAEYLHFLCVSLALLLTFGTQPLDKSLSKNSCKIFLFWL